MASQQYVEDNHSVYNYGSTEQVQYANAGCVKIRGKENPNTLCNAGICGLVWRGEKWKCMP